MNITADSQLCRAILESLPAAVYVVDRERRILLWNGQAEKISGFLRHEVIGRICRDNILMHCNEHGTVLCGEACPLAETMRDGRAREVEVYMRHKKGHRVPVRVQCGAGAQRVRRRLWAPRKSSKKWRSCRAACSTARPWRLCCMPNSWITRSGTFRSASC